MILVFGKNGQVGNELQKFNNVIALGKEDADFMEPLSCKKLIKDYVPDVVINAAAYTNVDLAEQNEASATIINGHTPLALAQACSEIEIPLIHISTDYVFDGNSKIPWSTDDKTNPINAYGRSKLLGENNIMLRCNNYAIIRTSWIFSAYRNNFLKTMLGLAKTQKEIKVVSDQIGSPTPAVEIAKACMLMASILRKNSQKKGIYHFSGYPNVSWYEFARMIFEMTRFDIKVLPVTSSEYESSTKRPLNSRLNCDSTIKNFDISLPDWRIELRKILHELGYKL